MERGFDPRSIFVFFDYGPLQICFVVVKLKL